MVRLVPSLQYPNMYKIAWGDGSLSDMVNYSRARDILNEARKKAAAEREKKKRTKT
jgi:hypothetical protein